MLTRRDSDLELLENDNQSPIDQYQKPEEQKEEEEAKLPDGDQDFYQGYADADHSETFVTRIKADYKIIKENLKTKVVWHYYLYWLLAGLEPTFGTIGYFWLKEVYQITQV